MLTDSFEKLNGIRFVEWLRAYLRSPWHPTVIAALMIASELFSLELPVFYVYLAFGILIVLFERDTLPLVPVIACCYMTISAKNNPGKFTDTIFSSPSFRIQLLLIIVVAVALLIVRMVSFLVRNPKRKYLPEMTFGFAALSAAYLLGGAFSGFYGGRTVLFGLAQIGSLTFAYFYFIYTIDWATVPKNYLMSIFLTIGVGVAVQTIGMYALPGVIGENGVNRSAMYTGWGIYNNVGSVMTMCVPAPFYFAARRKEGWTFSMLGIAFYLAVLLSQSRTAMLFGSIVFAACVVIVLVKTKSIERWKHVVVYASFLVVGVVCAVVFRQKLQSLFRSIIDIGTNPFGRPMIWKACLKKFVQFPIFGVGFYETPGGLLYNGGIADLAPCPPDVFIPPRAHNTYCQLLASGGLFAITAYGVHRAETITTLFLRPTTEKVFASLCICALVLTSLLDCHFFNFGPAILYSILLALSEGENRRDGVRGSLLFRRRFRT